MFNYEYPPLGGGGGVINKLLAEALSAENNITLVTSRFLDQQAYEICNGVEIFRVPVCFRNNQNAATILSMLSFFPSSLWTGHRLLKTRRFDLIHSLFAIPSAPSGFLLARKYRIPHVLSLLGGDVYDPSKRLSPHRTPLLHTVVERIVNGSDIVIGMSSDIVARAHTYYDITREIVLIPHSIARPVFAPKTRQELGYAPEEIILVTVGRLIPRKAIQDLLLVVRALHDPRIKLLIVGDGPERRTLEACAKAMQVSEQVRFLGNVSGETKYQLLNIADIYVSSTQHEGFGLVFLEAMASGLPIVSYDNGGHVDFLINYKTGFLVKLNDTSSLTEHIRELCGNADLRRNMGEFNKRYVEDYYVENCAKKYQELYDGISRNVSSKKDVLMTL
jgi:glycosyltransferase involved in cell wall biosynthesis